ncbi:MAG: hypothetical protein ACYTAS_11880 [Planctomycetota bacterium]|jgi:hypothetical protein
MRHVLERQWVRVGCLSVALAAIAGGCRDGQSRPFRQGSATVPRTIEQVQDAHTEAWMAIPGVVGTAIGLHEDKPCIMVLTAANPEQIGKQIPSTVEGYPVIMQHTGEFRALDQP